MNEYEHRRRRTDAQQRTPQRRTGQERASGQRRVSAQQRSRRAGDASVSNQVRRRNRDVEECMELERESVREHQEYLERRRRRQEKRRKEEIRRKKQLEMRMKMAGAGFIAILLIFGVYKLFFSNPVEKKITVEAGTKDLTPKNFLKKKKAEAKFVTDMSGIDLNHVGEHEIILESKGKKRKCRMTVVDTKPPKAKAEALTIGIDGDLKPEELVTDIKDGTDVTCEFKEKPDLSQKGTVTAVVVLTDEGGNKTEISAEIKVIKDKEAPVIEGVAPLTAFVGDTISYKSDITVTDNCDKKVELKVDNSDVDPETEGTYDVIYTATDRAGNVAEEETTITLKEKPENFVEPEKVEKEADKVLEEITTDDMTVKEKAKAIYNWTRENIGYVSTSEKESWTNGAYQGFTEKQGDCFIYFSVAKALLTQAGIPNIDVVKSDTSHSRHYWSLADCGDGWYHFDTTPRQGGGNFFMKTDEEILKYSKAHKNSHIFDQSLYPATPKEKFSMD